MDSAFAPPTSEELLALLERNGWSTLSFRRPLTAGHLLAGLNGDAPEASRSTGSSDVGHDGGQHAARSEPCTAGAAASRPLVSDVVAAEALRAYGRIRPYIRCTPLEPSPWLEGQAREAAAAAQLGPAAAAAAAPDTTTGAPAADGSTAGQPPAPGGKSGGGGVRLRGSVALKLESEQHSGSFKARGAVNKLLSMSALRRTSGSGSGGCVAAAESGAVLYVTSGSRSTDPAASYGPSESPAQAATPSKSTATTVYTASTGNHALAVLYACTALRRQRQQRCAQLAATGGPSALVADVEVETEGEIEAAGVGWQQDGGEEQDEGEGLAPLVAPVLYVPETASQYKISKLRSLGARLVLHGTDCLEAETAARAAAAAAEAAHAAAGGSGGGGGVYVSPYNDIWVMAGQGTLALELLAARRRGQLDAVLVPVGGGGLVAGVAAVLKAADPGILVVGCQPAASDVMARSVAAGGRIQPEAAPPLPTLSDATAGGVEEDSLTLQPCVDCVDEWVCVDEQEIAAALVGLLREQSKLVEGAAAVALAAYRRLAARLASKHVAVVCCGGNVSLDSLRQAMELAGHS